MKLLPTAALAGSVLLAGCGGGVARRPATVHWTAVPAVDDGADASVARLTSGAPGVVAVGSVEEPQGSVAAVWTSGDSAHWVRVADDRAVFPVGSAMRSATTGAGGFTAVGTVGDAAAVWTSGDGRHWHRQAANDTSLAHAVMGSVTGGVGPGYVAVGTKDSHAAAWYSGDGRRWRLARVPVAPAGSRLNKVVAAAPEVIAVGTDGQTGAVWASDDGVHWTRWQPRGQPFAFGSELKAVLPTAPGYVAVGRTPTGPASWRSADGVHWTEVSLGTGDAEADAVVVASPGLVAVGGGAQGIEAWVSDDAARHWHSADAGFSAPAPARLRTILVIRPGLIVGGDVPGTAIWTAS